MELAEVEVAGLKLCAPPNHIYASSQLPPLYDVGPWSYISDNLSTASGPIGLIDVGSNIGDSVAHFRKFSSGKAVCVDASSDYCAIFLKNEALLGDVELIQSLVIPDVAPAVNGSEGGKALYRFTSDGQTGMTEITDNIDGAYKGDTISVSNLIKKQAIPSIFKSDTDGFDSHIMKSVADLLDETVAPLLPVLFFEGPSAGQMLSGSPVIDSYADSICRLIRLGYHCTIFGNHGAIFAECEKSSRAVQSCFTGLKDSYSQGRPYCHYFDIVLCLPGWQPLV